MTRKLKTCCGCYTLEGGILSIGFFDTLRLVVTIIWVILAGVKNNSMNIDSSVYDKIILIRVLGIEFPRVLIFFIGLKLNFPKVSRLIMFLVRIVTIAL